jgi:tRNA-dihydrouridine synthase C
METFDDSAASAVLLRHPPGAPIAVRLGVPALVLAPMEGVTDAPIRALFGEIGGFDFCVGEFFRISQQVAPLKSLAQHLPELALGAKTPSGLPVQCQLLGGDPERLALSAQVAVLAGATAVDLNFGCPARTVNRHDGGASLLKSSKRIYDCVRAVRLALPPGIPVSAKLRLGWEDPADIDENAEMAAAGGASWLTVHARTRAAGYRPPVHWHYLSGVRRRLGLPIVANGDIWTLEDFRRCQDVSGCEHFMLGRGAMADPYLPRRIAAEWGGPAAPSIDELQQAWPALMRRFVDLVPRPVRHPLFIPGRLKQWAKMAQHTLKPGAYEKMKRLTDPQQILAAI